MKSDYPTVWPEISRLVKGAAGWRCVRCGHPHGPDGKRLTCDDNCRHRADGKQRILTTHHLDSDKTNCMWWNLAALCQVCHLHVQATYHPDQMTFAGEEWMRPHTAARRMARSGHVLEEGPMFLNTNGKKKAVEQASFLAGCIRSARRRYPDLPLVACTPVDDLALQVAAAVSMDVIWVRKDATVLKRHLWLRPWVVHHD